MDDNTPGGWCWWEFYILLTFLGKQKKRKITKSGLVSNAHVNDHSTWHSDENYPSPILTIFCEDLSVLQEMFPLIINPKN